ncbi:hypothetical protein Pelo_7191 [Pelomyxa schiedti]|nr:hypothetical protein Pelo_7191 [Pelomyxa schiedti]
MLGTEGLGPDIVGVKASYRGELRRVRVTRPVTLRSLLAALRDAFTLVADGRAVPDNMIEVMWRDAGGATMPLTSDDDVDLAVATVDSLPQEVPRLLRLTVELKPESQVTPPTQEVHSSPPTASPPSNIFPSGGMFPKIPPNVSPFSLLQLLTVPGVRDRAVPALQAISNCQPLDPLPQDAVNELASIAVENIPEIAQILGVSSASYSEKQQAVAGHLVQALSTPFVRQLVPMAISLISQPAQPPQMPSSVPSVICSQCRAAMTGERFKCTVCPNTIICSQCCNAHDSSHSLVALFIEPKAAPVTVLCDEMAMFVSDVNIEPGTPLETGNDYIKIWRVKNNTPTPWPQDTQLVHFSGDFLGANTTVSAVAPSTEGEIFVEILPKEPGHRVGEWRLMSGGSFFGARLKIDVIVL